MKCSFFVIIKISVFNDKVIPSFFARVNQRLCFEYYLLNVFFFPNVLYRILYPLLLQTIFEMNGKNRTTIYNKMFFFRGTGGGINPGNESINPSGHFCQLFLNKKYDMELI